MKKKFLSLMVALSAITALGAANFEVDGIAYNLLGGDSVEVTSKSPAYSDTITIPATVTYQSQTYRVTRIGDRAFSSCASLMSITIPNSVTSIGYEAFYKCSSITSITIPNSVTSIGEDAFSSCTSLTSVTIPNSVTSIGSGAFESCTSLTSITIPNSVTSIGYRAFYSCTSLTSITIPNSVTSIGDEAFRECSSLSSITVDASNTHYSSIDGVLFNYAKDTLIQYPIGNTRTSYTIPNSVTSIGDYAFRNCKSLTSITIPNSVTSIGGQAFTSCTSLTSITIPNSVTSIGGYAFYGCYSLPVENNLRYVDTYLVNAANKTLPTCSIKEGTKWIGDDAFRSWTPLTSITIPNSVTSIGDYAFYKCTSLTSITIPNSVTSIGGSAFSSCTSLTSITCEATTPPTCGYYCFENIDKSIPLYVPAESISAYQTADKWKDFTNIQSISTFNPDHPINPGYYEVKLSANPVEGGIVMGAGNYTQDSVVTIEAHALAGYYFTGWSDGVIDSVRNVHVGAHDTAFVANFKKSKYWITFNNYDNTRLYRDTFEYGAMPEYKGKTPTKPSNKDWDYNFAGWYPTIQPVTGEAIYKAYYDSVRACMDTVIVASYQKCSDLYLCDQTQVVVRKQESSMWIKRQLLRT